MMVEQVGPDFKMPQAEVAERMESIRNRLLVENTAKK